MGYLINNFLQKVEVEISAANVAVMDSVPQQVIKSNELTNYCIVAATISMKNQTGDVSNYGHFYLGAGYALGDKMAVYDENIGTLSNNKVANFILNVSHPPNRFGSISQYASDLTIFSELPPTPNGDLIVTVYYFNKF